MGLHEIILALPTILSLVILEGLLSVDNAMAIAAMASHLPKNQQKLALRFGLIGAYAFRGVALALAAWIAANPFLKIFGAVYLIYLMCQELSDHGETDEATEKELKAKGFLATVLSIEILDLSLSLDNVVAAVALDKRLWVVCAGVFIGILVLRFVAGLCISLIEKFPILAKTAFLLVGFIGMTLLAELGMGWEIDGVHKFSGIAAIVASSLCYSQTDLGKKIFGPVVWAGRPLINWGNRVFDVATYPITYTKSVLTSTKE